MLQKFSLYLNFHCPRLPFKILRQYLIFYVSEVQRLTLEERDTWCKKEIIFIESNILWLQHTFYIFQNFHRIVVKGIQKRLILFGG